MFIHILLNDKEETEQDDNFIGSYSHQTAKSENSPFKIKTYINSPDNMPQFLVEIIIKKMISLLIKVKVFFNIL